MSDRSQLRGAQQYLTSTAPHPQTVQVIKTKRSLRDCPRQEEPEETLRAEALHPGWGPGTEKDKR